MDKLEKLESVFAGMHIDVDKVIGALRVGWKSTGLWVREQINLIHSFFIQKDINKTKHCSFLCGIIDEIEIEKLDAKILDAGINHLAYALLTDCQPLICTLCQPKT